MSNRQALMGHAAASMTQRYTHEDLARQAAGVEQIAEKLCGGGEMAASGGPDSMKFWYVFGMWPSVTELRVFAECAAKKWPCGQQKSGVEEVIGQNLHEPAARV